MIEDWDDYRIFLSVAENGTLKAAAAELKVNLSTVLRRINTFEEKMGVRLFDRSHDGFTLTSPGEIIKKHASEMQHLVLDLMRKVKDADHQLGGVIKLATTDSLFQSWLGLLLQAFRKQYPDIYFECLVSPQNLDLAKHEADIAVSVGNIRPDYMIGRKLMPVHYKFYGLASLYENKAPITDADQLKTLPIMSMNTDFSHHPFYKWQKTHLPESIDTNSTDRFTAMHQMISLGLGIGILPNYLGDSDSKLVTLFTLPEETNKDVWLLTHSDLRNVKRVRSFMEFVRKYTEQNTKNSNT